MKSHEYIYEKILRDVQKYISKNKKALTKIHNLLLKRLSENIEEMEKDIAKLKAKLKAKLGA